MVRRSPPFSSVNAASFDVRYRQDLAAERIHAWLLHTSLARRPLLSRF